VNTNIQIYCIVFKYIYISASQTFLCCGPAPLAPRLCSPLELNFVLRRLTWKVA